MLKTAGFSRKILLVVFVLFLPPCASGAEPSGKKALSAIEKGATALLPASDGDCDNPCGILETLEARGVRP